MWKQGLFVGTLLAALVGFATIPTSCGGRVGIGASCSEDAECHPDHVCVTDFRGGYCGKADCSSDGDCPDGSICVTVGIAATATPTMGNFCLATCEQDDECVEDRFDALSLDEDELPTCAGEVTRVGDASDNVCIPPLCTASGGTTTCMR